MSDEAKVCEHWHLSSPQQMMRRAMSPAIWTMVQLRPSASSIRSELRSLSVEALSKEALRNFPPK